MRCASCCDGFPLLPSTTVTVHRIDENSKHTHQVETLGIGSDATDVESSSRWVLVSHAVGTGCVGG